MVVEGAFDLNDTRYETISCLACSGVHLVNPNTGVVVGAPRKTRR